MLKTTYEQQKFIQKEYSLLSGQCAKFFVTDEHKELKEARVKLAVFVNTIENLFNCDFYKEILVNY